VIGRAGLQTVAILHRERANKVFGSDLHDCSLASSSSLSRLVYLFARRVSRVVGFNANSVRPICIGIILLDNLLQCLLFIAMIDLSRTCGSITSLICNLLVMFMIYPWIKIKLKVLIFLTI
jgi:hypothetical protein